MVAVTGPGHYYRAPNLITGLGELVKVLGRKACIIGGKTALDKVGQGIQESLRVQGIESGETLWYGGECNLTHIKALENRIETQLPAPDFLIGVGGGKALDTVKALGYRLNLPVVVVPTIASTCAATTGISILYDDRGTFVEISREARRPDFTIVDTEVICQAPARFLVAGIGDTLAKWFESKASIQKVQPNAINGSALALAQHLYSFLLQVGSSAVQAVQNQELNSDLEAAIDAILLVSGSVSGYGGDDCRTAAAHAIYSGLTIFPEVHQVYHGEIVAFGILAQLALEKKPEEEVNELLAFYREVNLPSTLKALGLNKTELTEEQWAELGRVSVEIEDMANMPFPVTPQMVIEGIKQADRWGELWEQRRLLQSAGAVMV